MPLVRVCATSTTNDRQLLVTGANLVAGSWTTTCSHAVGLVLQGSSQEAETRGPEKREFLAVLSSTASWELYSSKTGTSSTN